MLYEVEVRNLLKPKGYKKLLKYLKKNGKLISEGKENTIQLQANGADLRLVVGDKKVQLVLKDGKNTHEVRPEMSVEADKENLETMLYIWQSLGYKVKMKWEKKRKIFRWQGINFCLDNIRGFGLLLEMEKLVDGRTKDKSYKNLQKKKSDLLKKLEIPESTKKELDDKIEDYKANWRKYLSKQFTRI